MSDSARSAQGTDPRHDCRAPDRYQIGGVADRARGDEHVMDHQKGS